MVVFIFVCMMNAEKWEVVMKRSFIGAMNAEKQDAPEKNVFNKHDENQK